MVVGAKYDRSLTAHLWMYPPFREYFILGKSKDGSIDAALCFLWFAKKKATTIRRSWEDHGLIHPFG